MLRSSAALAVALGASAAGNVDVEAAFKGYCSSFCGGGGYANCDIGNGHIGSSVKAPPLGKVLPGKPAFNATLHATSGACEEKTDLHSCKDGVWCGFTYKCTATSATFDGMAYSNIQSKPVDDKDGFVFTHWIDNDSSNPQSTTVEFDETTTNSATLSLSNTVKVGVTLKVSASVPEVMSTEFSESFEVSSTETQSNTMTSTKNWKITQPVLASPQSTVKATLVIQKTIVSGDWSATVNLPESAKVWCNNKVNDHYEWFVPSTLYLPKDQCIGTKCPVRGTFSGFHGVSSSTIIKECPLYSRDC